MPKNANFLSCMISSFASRAFIFEIWFVWATLLKILFFSQDWAQKRENSFMHYFSQSFASRTFKYEPWLACATSL